jgi:uncharacterized surface anchored protein
VKQVDVGLVDWKIQLLKADGSIARVGHTDGSGIVKFEHLASGPYQVVEESRPGFAHDTPPVLDVNVTGSACVEVFFDNHQEDNGFCIEGRKIDKNGYVGLPGWVITAEALDKGGIELDDATTNGLGEFMFTLSGDDYRVPGSRYKICAEDVDGWEHEGPACQIVTLPKYAESCFEMKDFVNYQVGHGEGKKDGGMYAKCEGKQHHVKAGEQLFVLAHKYGVTAQEMVDANPQVRENSNFWIYEGDKLCIPDHADSSWNDKDNDKGKGQQPQRPQGGM